MRWNFYLFIYLFICLFAYLFIYLGGEAGGGEWLKNSKFICRRENNKFPCYYNQFCGL